MKIVQLIEKGKVALVKNMEMSPSFDPNKPYEEKNTYFLEVNQLGFPLFQNNNLVSPATIYYKEMLRVILEYENQNTKRFNKGMVYANVGIAQIANGNLDEGIHYLLMADREDADFAMNPHGLLDGVLWQQFERPHVIENLINLNNNTFTNLHFQVTEAFIQNMLRRMDLQDRLFLEATIWTIFRNLKFNTHNSNYYTRGRLLSGLKDVCLLGESLLRKYQISQGLISANSRITLGNTGNTPGLLTNTVSGLRIGYPQRGLSVSANSLLEFLDNVENILQQSSSPEICRIYCFHLVRNFTGHHFDVSSQVISSSGKEFFDLYEHILVNVLSTILYFESMSII